MAGRIEMIGGNPVWVDEQRENQPDKPHVPFTLFGKQFIGVGDKGEVIEYQPGSRDLEEKSKLEKYKQQARFAVDLNLLKAQGLDDAAAFRGALIRNPQMLTEGAMTAMVRPDSRAREPVIDIPLPKANRFDTGSAGSIRGPIDDPRIQSIIQSRTNFPSSFRTPPPQAAGQPSAATHTFVNGQIVPIGQQQEAPIPLPAFQGPPKPGRIYMGDYLNSPDEEIPAQ